MKDYVIVYNKLINEKEEKWTYHAKVIEAEDSEKAVHMIEAEEGTEIPIEVLNIEESK